MLSKDPAQRIKLHEIGNHRWMKRFQPVKVGSKRFLERDGSNNEV